MLSTLWIDQPDAEGNIPAKVTDAYLQDRLREFVERGFTIFRGVVDPETLEDIKRDMHNFRENPREVVMNRQGKYIDPATVEKLGPGERILDIYGRSAAAREAMFTRPVAEFLQLVFEEPVIAMQSISFEYGSRQEIHQDTAYVVASKPLSLAASWLALEDIVEGSGELTYYPGSHRFRHFLFSGKYKAWQAPRDGHDQHRAFLDQLHEQAKEMGIAAESFLAKAGDVLIWHADLAHGGGAIKDPALTRRSLVTHYCPRSVKPNYRDKSGKDYYELPDASGNFFASRHYRLKDLDHSGWLNRGTDKASIYFDGGITAKRGGGKSKAAKQIGAKPVARPTEAQVVFIAGASRGIGLALSKLYAGEGAAVFGNGRSEAPAEAVDGFQYLKCELKDLDGQMFEGAGLERIDTLVLNAAVPGPMPAGNPLEADINRLKHITAANAFYELQVIQRALPLLKRSASPRVAFIISRAGDQRRIDGTGSIYYRVSKAAQLALALSLQPALRKEGVIVRLINPGSVQTKIGGAKARLTADESAKGIKAILDAAALDDAPISYNFDGTPLKFS